MRKVTAAECVKSDGCADSRRSVNFCIGDSEEGPNLGGRGTRRQSRCDAEVGWVRPRREHIFYSSGGRPPKNRSPLRGEIKNLLLYLVYYFGQVWVGEVKSKFYSSIAVQGISYRCSKIVVTQRLWVEAQSGPGSFVFEEFQKEVGVDTRARFWSLVANAWVRRLYLALCESFFYHAKSCPLRHSYWASPFATFSFHSRCRDRVPLLRFDRWFAIFTFYVFSSFPHYLFVFIFLNTFLHFFLVFTGFSGFFVSFSFLLKFFLSFFYLVLFVSFSFSQIFFVSLLIFHCFHYFHQCFGFSYIYLFIRFLRVFQFLCRFSSVSWLLSFPLSFSFCFLCFMVFLILAFFFVSFTFLSKFFISVKNIFLTHV